MDNIPSAGGRSFSFLRISSTSNLTVCRLLSSFKPASSASHLNETNKHSRSHHWSALQKCLYWWHFWFSRPNFFWNYSKLDWVSNEQNFLQSILICFLFHSYNNFTILCYSINKVYTSISIIIISIYIYIHVSLFQPSTGHTHAILRAFFQVSK